MVAKKKKKKDSVSVRPLGDRVLVRRSDTGGEEVRGGIIIPDTAKEKPLEADVVAVGEGRRLDDGSRVPVDVEVGDRVLIGKYSGTDIKLGGEEFSIVNESEILGIIG